MTTKKTLTKRIEKLEETRAGYRELNMWTQRVGGYLKKKHAQTLQQFLKDAQSLRKQGDLDDKELAAVEEALGPLIDAYEEAYKAWRRHF
jgi:hypothetical protein